MSATLKSIGDGSLWVTKVDSSPMPASDVLRSADTRSTRWPPQTRPPVREFPAIHGNPASKKFPAGIPGNFAKFNFISLIWGRCHENSVISPHFSNLKYRIKIAVVHGGTDAEQSEFAVFNNCRYSVFFSKRNTDVEISLSVLVVKFK